MKAAEALSAWTLHCMRTSQAHWSARVWLALLRPASLIYRGLVVLRTALFAYGLTGVRRLPVPVLSVGNLVAGGSGKTPFVEMLATRLRERSRRVAIVLRGYRGGSNKPMIICDGRRFLCEPPMAADEAYLLGRHLSGVAVLTGADRYLVGQRALQELQCEIIVLDDGFQHLWLHRDLDIVLVDATNPFGYGRMLPSGLLRERPEALARADLLVVTHADRGADLDQIRRDLRRYAPAVPIILAVHRPLGLIALNGDVQPLPRLDGERVVAFSGIGNPESFEATLVRLGATVVVHQMFPDHHRYSSVDLEAISAVAKRADASVIITTEKDLIKLVRLERGTSAPPMYALSIGLELVEGAATLERMLDAVLGASSS